MPSIEDILNYLKYENLRHTYTGNENLSVENYSSIFNPKPKAITWIKKIDEFDLNTIPKDLGLVIVANETELDVSTELNFIFCDEPKEVFFSILKHFWIQNEYESSISPLSIVLTKDIGENVYIGHNSYISKDTIIGNNVVIKNNVSLEGKIAIGDNVLIHSGVVMGTDGYGLYKDENGLNQKVPHYGGIVIGNDVEIGANTCIDRGTLDDTIIGDNVKIDNLCQIGHNVCIESNACIVATSILCGSCKIGKNAYIAPGAEIINQVSVGEDSMVGIGAVVIKDVPSNCTVLGNPARAIWRKED